MIGEGYLLLKGIDFNGGDEKFETSKSLENSI